MDNLTTAQAVDFWENCKPAYSMKQIEAMAHGVPWRNMLTSNGSEIWDSAGLPIATCRSPLTAALICNAVNGEEGVLGAFLTPAELSMELEHANEQLEKLWTVIQNPSVVNFMAAVDSPKGKA